MNGDPIWNDSDLRAYWRLDGNGLDETRDHNGTLNGPPENVTGIIRNALEFDGANDYVEIDVENEIISGKEKKRILKTGDPIRARIVAVSINELSARESKIGLTMRQPSLGSHEWLNEPIDVQDKSKEHKIEKKKRKGKK